MQIINTKNKCLQENKLQVRHAWVQPLEEIGREWIIIKSLHCEMVVSRSENDVYTRMTLRFSWVSLLVPWFESDSD